MRGAGLAILGTSLHAVAQTARAMPRIGYLTPGTNPREAAFWEGMRELGYVDGKTIVVDRRSGDGDFSRLPVLAAEIVKNRPDVFVAVVSASAIAAKQATSTHTDRDAGPDSRRTRYTIRQASSKASRGARGCSFDRSP